MNLVRETPIEAVKTGIAKEINLLAREYVPNPSGPNSLAKILVSKIMDMIVITEVNVVNAMSFRNGLNFILVEFKKIYFPYAQYDFFTNSIFRFYRNAGRY